MYKYMYFLLLYIHILYILLYVCMNVCVYTSIFTRKKDVCTGSSIRHVLYNFRPFSVEHDDFISLGMSKK